MKVSAVINSASGSTPAEASAVILTEELSRLRHRIGIVLEAEPARIETAVSEALASDPELLVVWGGDGTIRTVLDAAGMEGPAILVLPGGTINALSNRLHGKSDWKTILRRIPEAKVSALSAGVTNDRRFYTGLLAGAPNRLNEAREALRSGQLDSLVESARDSLSGDLDRRLGIEVPDHPVLDTWFTSLFLARDFSASVDVFAFDPGQPLELMTAAWTFFLGTLDRSHPAFVGSTDTVRITSEWPIEVLLDGEPVPARKNYEIEVVASVARTLVTRNLE